MGSCGGVAGLMFLFDFIECSVDYFIHCLGAVGVVKVECFVCFVFIVVEYGYLCGGAEYVDFEYYGECTFVVWYCKCEGSTYYFVFTFV